MAFNELSFLFLFFPIAWVLHTLAPQKLRNWVLLLLSVLFFAWGTPEYVVLMMLSILFNYFSGLQMSRQKQDQKAGAARFTLISAVAVNLLLLGFFKYWGFVLENINAVLGTAFSARQLPMPVGISFFTFSILSYLFDVYRDKTPAAENFLDFSLYVLLFGKLVSGPIVPYHQMREQLSQRTVDPVASGEGTRLFLIGLAKKVILSGAMSTTFYAISALEQLSVVSAWLGALSYTLMLYFDFSGYSDMAIGLGRMLGFRFDKNFDYPYTATSLTDFWRRWHISLGAWFRDYVYIPLGGSRAGLGKTVRNLMIVWLLTGIWHGASWSFIAWGLYHGLLLLAEKFLLKNLLEKLPSAIRKAGTFLLVLIGWVFFFSPGLGDALSWLGCMFGIGAAGILDTAAKYYLASSWIMLVISIFGACPLPANMGSHIYRKSTTATALSLIWFGVLLVLCVAGLMSGTYSTFLYAQF